MAAIFLPIVQWLGTMIASLLAIFGISLAKRFTLGAAAVAASIALYIGLAATIHALLSGLVQTLPSWASHAGLFLPDNIVPCVTAIIAARFAFAFYEWNLTNLKIMATIN